MAYQDKLKPIATTTPAYQAKLKPVAEPKPSLLSTLAGRYKEGAGGAAQQVKDVAMGRTDLATGARRFRSRAFGAAGRAASDVIGAGVSLLVPDALEAKLSEKTAPILAPVVKPALQLYAKIKEADPELARDIDDIFGMSELTGVGAATRPVRPLISSAAKNVTRNMLPDYTSVKATAARDIDTLLKSTRGIESKVKLAEQKNVDLPEILSDPVIFRGLAVENGTINPDRAIDVLESRIDTLLDAKRSMLPLFDRALTPIDREMVRDRAKAQVRDTVAPADEDDILSAIDRQVDALPARISLTQLDDFRARFRQSARDAKGLQKRANEYAALENATRDTVFDATDSLPFDAEGQFGALNTYIKDMIEAKTFLDKSLRGQKVKGGRIGTFTGRVIGAIAGVQGGVLGALAGSEVGGAVAGILVNNSLGSSLKMKLIREMTDDPQIIREAEQLLQKAQQYDPLNRPALPPPGTASTINQGRTVPVVPSDRAGVEYVGRETAAGGRYTPPNEPPTGRPRRSLQLDALEPYTPPNELPVIKAGRVPRPPRSNLPIIR